MTKFEEALERAGYVPKDRDALIDAIDDGRTRRVIALPKLMDFLKKL